VATNFPSTFDGHLAQLGEVVFISQSKKRDIPPTYDDYIEIAKQWCRENRKVLGKLKPLALAAAEAKKPIEALLEAINGDPRLKAELDNMSSHDFYSDLWFANDLSKEKQKQFLKNVVSRLAQQ